MADQARQAFGMPTLHMPPVMGIEDEAVKRAVTTALEHLRRETQEWLRRIAEQVDTITGLRGEPKVYAPLNAQGHRIRNIGTPVDDTDAAQKGSVLSLEGEVYNARNRQIINVVAAQNDTEAVNLSQITNFDAYTIGGFLPTAFVQRDGSTALTADWDAGAFQIRAETFQSDVTTGTAPLTVASTTTVTNLDADTVDGVEGADILQRDGSVALTAAWDAGSFQIRAETFQSDIATGTAPLTVASTTTVTNLDADTVDGVEGAEIIQRDGSVAFTGDVDVGDQDIINVGVNSCEILSGTVDPTAGAGVVATIGSLYMRNNSGTGEGWLKTAAGDTAWTQFI